jgi:hypothetical protein
VGRSAVGRGPGDEHAGALAAALLLPGGGAVTVAGGGVVEQRVRRWRQHRGRATLLGHMVAESLRRWTKQKKNVGLAVAGGGVSRRASAGLL